MATRKQCVLYDRECIECGECDKCDLDPSKKCDNCMKCIRKGADYRAVKIDQILLNQEYNAITDNTTESSTL